MEWNALVLETNVKYACSHIKQNQSGQDKKSSQDVNFFSEQNSKTFKGR